MPEFIKSLDLSKLLFEEQIQPLICNRFPNLKYAAATLGMCSEILGLDDEVSMDHEWGPRVTLYLSDEDFPALSMELEKILKDSLPSSFQGFDMIWRQEGIDIHDTRKTPLYHVYINTVSRRLGFAGGYQALPLKCADWLKVSEQHLLEFTSGIVYRDDLGKLTWARDMLACYPNPVLRFLLMHEWNAIGSDWFPIGRIGSRGDKFGLSLQTSKIVNHLMRIAFLTSRSYCTYKKWFGTLFSKLPIAGTLSPVLHELLGESDWRKAEELAAQACSILLENQNRLGFGKPLELEMKKANDNRHHLDLKFWDIGKELGKDLPSDLQEIIDRQVFWLDERNLILWNGEIGKWPMFLMDEK